MILRLTVLEYSLVRAWNQDDHASRLFEPAFTRIPAIRSYNLSRKPVAFDSLVYLRNSNFTPRTVQSNNQITQLLRKEDNIRRRCTSDCNDKISKTTRLLLIGLSTLILTTGHALGHTTITFCYTFTVNRKVCTLT